MRMFVTSIRCTTSRSWSTSISDASSVISCETGFRGGADSWLSERTKIKIKIRSKIND